jgi:hypothetical protein
MRNVLDKIWRISKYRFYVKQFFTHKRAVKRQCGKNVVEPEKPQKAP